MVSRRRRGRRGGRGAWSGWVGRYRLADEIGAGAHGTVFRAWDRRTRSWVAVKVLADRAGHQGAWRFLREQGVAVDHPSVIAVLDRGSDSSGAWIVTELLDAGTLEDALSERGAIAPDLALLWSSEVLDALATLGRAGVVHRDVKPSNIMLRAEADGPRAVLADFGQAWVDDGVEITSTPGPVGTRGYVAPELHTADPLATTASDVYAVGVTLRRLLSGGGPTAPLPVTVPVDLATLVADLTATDPADRPAPTEAAQRARSLLERRSEAGLAPAGQAATPSRLDRPPDPFRRRKVALAVAALLATNVATAWVVSRPEPAAAPTAADRRDVEWTIPDADRGRPLAVTDDGEVYVADRTTGVVWRLEDDGPVPVAGGGAIGTDRGAALDLDLTSAHLEAGDDGPPDLTALTNWTLAAGPDGELWLNTGDIWRIDPDGRGERVLAATAEGPTPYTTHSFDDDPSVFDRGSITAEASRLRARDGGVDFLDSTGLRVAHLNAGGEVTDVCDLSTVERTGPADAGFSAPGRHGDDGFTPTSFAVVAPDDCWVVDGLFGAVVHVVDGAAEERAYGPTQRSTDEPTGWTSSPPTGDTTTASFVELLGTRPGGEVVALTTVIAPSMVTFTDGDAPARVVPIVEWDAPAEDTEPFGGGVAVAQSPDGGTLAGSFTRLTPADSSDPRLEVDDHVVTTLATDDVLADDELLLPDGLRAGRPIAAFHLAASRSTTRSELVDSYAYRDGQRSEEVTLGFTSFATSMQVADDEVVVGAEAFVWRMGTGPTGHLALALALRPPGSDSGDGCRVQDLARHPTQPTASVLCRDEDGYRIVEVDLDGARAPDATPRIVVDQDAFARGAEAIDAASELLDDVVLGPHLDIDHGPEGRLIVVSADDQAVFEVRSGELDLVTDYAGEGPADDAEADALAAIDAVADDPVRVRAGFEAYRATIIGTDADLCAGARRATGPFSPVATVALDDGRILMAMTRCLLVVTPGVGTRPLPAGDAPVRGVTRLARSGSDVFAYDRLTAEIWRIPLDGSGASDLVAGRRLLPGGSPDGARAAGSPIATVGALAVDDDGRPCWVDTGFSSVRCVDDRGALVTLTGPSIEPASPTDRRVRLGLPAGATTEPRSADPCTGGVPAASAPDPEATSMTAGGLTVPVAPWYAALAISPTAFPFADGMTQAGRDVTEGWLANYGVGGLPRADPDVGVEAAADHAVECVAASDGLYSGEPTVTEVSRGAVTVDGAAAFSIVVEVRTDTAPGPIEGDRVQVVVVDTGRADQLGFYINAVPIDDEDLIEQQTSLLDQVRLAR